MKPAPAMRPHHSAKLTQEQVRTARDSKEPAKIFAITYNVSEATISRIRHKTRWGWLK